MKRKSILLFAIALLVFFNMSAVISANIPIGGDFKTITLEYNYEKLEYGYNFVRCWIPFDSPEVGCPVKYQVLRDKTDRIKDRFRELLF